MLYCTVDVPDDVRVDEIAESALPPRWFRSPAPPDLQAIGDAWVRRGEAVALLVPSAIARIEKNAVLNPHHASFARLAIGEFRDLPVDERLHKRQIRAGFAGRHSRGS